jgi:hypothetical protein
MAMTGEERLQIALESTTVAFDEKANRAFYHCSLSNTSGWSLEEVICPLVFQSAEAAVQLPATGGTGPAMEDVEVAAVEVRVAAGAHANIHKSLSEVIKSAIAKGVSAEECFEHFDIAGDKKANLEHLAEGLVRLKLADATSSPVAATVLMRWFGAHCSEAGGVTLADFVGAFAVSPPSGGTESKGPTAVRDKSAETSSPSSSSPSLSLSSSSPAAVSPVKRRGSVWQASEEEDIKQMLMREEITFAQYKRLLDPATDYTSLDQKGGGQKYFKDGIEYEGGVNHYDDDDGEGDPGAHTDDIFDIAAPSVQSPGAEEETATVVTPTRRPSHSGRNERWASLHYTSQFPHLSP